MEGDSLTPTGLEWENLAPAPPQLAFSMRVSPPPTKFLAPFYDDLINLASSPEAVVGLRLGQHREYGDGSGRTSSIPTSSTPMKRSRASYQNMQNPCCQVEGCNLDLKLAKDYHRRHRICETHSKSPKVIVAGMERRFCQQCSRFHDLSEFDDKKRSCRRRLSDHNARRRRVQPESVQLSSAGLSPALYDQRQQNVLLNGLPVSIPNSRHTLLRPSKPSRGVDGTLNFSLDNLQSSIHSSNPRILDQCLHVTSTNSSMAPDPINAHSLLSSNAWSMNCSPAMRQPESESESNHLTLFHANNTIGVDEGSFHHQQYHLFNDSPTFYPTQRSL